MKAAGLMAATAFLAGTPACLSSGPGPAPSGQQLAHGRTVVGVSFAALAEPTVTYEVPSDGSGDSFLGPTDLHAVPFAGGADRLLATQTSQSWGRQWDAAGHLWIMRAQHDAPLLAPSGGALQVASLARVDVVGAGGTPDEIPEVADFSVLHGSGLLLYRAVTPGARVPELRLRTADGGERALGPNQGVYGFFRDHVYFLVGDAHTFKRLLDPAGEPELLAADVDNIRLRSDEGWAVVRTGTASGRRLFAIDLATRAASPLPGDAICSGCLLGYSPDGAQFLYAEAAPPVGAARLYVHTLRTEAAEGRTDVYDPPAGGLGPFQQLLWRGSTGTGVLGDASGHQVLYQPGADPVLHDLGVVGLVPSLQDGGRTLVWIESASGADPSLQDNVLYSLDLDTPGATPRRLSPEGSSVTGYFGVGAGPQIGFWAYFTDARSDLFMADATAGTSRQVASLVGPVAVSATRVVGVVRVQDGEFRGDLVTVDLATGAETLYAKDVTDFALTRGCDGCDPFAAGARLAYVVHAHAPADHDGVWATTLR